MFLFYLRVFCSQALQILIDILVHIFHIVNLTLTSRFELGTFGFGVLCVPTRPRARAFLFTVSMEFDFRSKIKGTQSLKTTGL